MRNRPFDHLRSNTRWRARSPAIAARWCGISGSSAAGTSSSRSGTSCWSAPVRRSRSGWRANGRSRTRSSSCVRRAPVRGSRSRWRAADCRAGGRRGAGAAAPIEVDLPHATLKRDEDGTPVWLYRIVVRARRGAQLAEAWRTTPSSRSARLSYYGSREEVAADLYHAEWGPIELPAEVIAGGRLTLPVTIRNASKPLARLGRGLSSSPTTGSPDGSVASGRASAPACRPTSPPASRPRCRCRSRPERTGSYDLVLEPVREGIAWFHERDRATPSAGT